MLPTNEHQGRRGLALLRMFVWVTACAASPFALSAQELPLRRDYPGSRPYECVAPTFETPGDEARAQARQLASDADNAVILGDLVRASSLLARATELDPASPEIAYGYARVLDDLGEIDAAMAEYCRTMSLGSEGTEIEDARLRLQAHMAARQASIPEEAVEAFVTGVGWADANLPEPAMELFGTALQVHPDWPEALYNRGVMLARLGRPAAAASDLRRYLELRPDAPDAIAVSERVGQLEASATVRLPGTGATLALGMLFPGMGQFYTGRTGPGSFVLALSSAAVATGLLVKNETVRCLTPVSPGEDCAPSQTVDVRSERPFLWPAIGAAAAVAVIGAIEAALDARDRRDAAQARPVLPSGVEEARGRVLGPAVSAHGSRMDLRIFGWAPR